MFEQNKTNKRHFTTSISILIGTLIPPPTRHLPFGSSKGLPITLLKKKKENNSPVIPGGSFCYPSWHFRLTRTPLFALDEAQK